MTVRPAANSTARRRRGRRPLAPPICRSIIPHRLATSIAPAAATMRRHTEAPVMPQVIIGFVCIRYYDQSQWFDGSANHISTHHKNTHTNGKLQID